MATVKNQLINTTKLNVNKQLIKNNTKKMDGVQTAKVTQNEEANATLKYNKLSILRSLPFLFFFATINYGIKKTYNSRISYKIRPTIKHYSET